MSYDVLMVDPPWVYANKKTGGSHTSGAAQKYPGLTVEELCALPVPSIASKTAVLFLWATTPLGADPYQVMEAWGFRFKTKMYWHKAGRKGTGYWLRGCVEELLIGVRGPTKAWRQNIDNFVEVVDDPVITAKPTGHSEKPKQAVRLIEQLTPKATSRIELFATDYSKGLALDSTALWDCYGKDDRSTDPDLQYDFRDPAFWAMLQAR